MFDPRRSSHILVVAPGQDPAGTLECAVVFLGDEKRIPDEIHVVASRQRLAAIQIALLSPAGARRFAALCAQAGFARDEILFNRRTLHSLDMNGEGGCAAAADRLLDLLRRLSSSGDTALTVAVAEEAGVPGYLLHCCLQVAGRSSDRLVILAAGQANGTRARSGRPACRQFEVPLLLWPPTDPPPATYAEAVLTRRTERRRAASRDVLRLDRRRRTVASGETSLTLPAMQFFWLYYLASTSGELFPLAALTARFGAGKRHQPFVQKLSDGRLRTFPGDLQRVFEQLFPHSTDKFDAMYQRACGPNPGLPSTISKINAALRRAFGRGVGPYLIESGRGAGGYRITLPASAIQIIGAEATRS